MEFFCVLFHLAKIDIQWHGTFIKGFKENKFRLLICRVLVRSH